MDDDFFMGFDRFAAHAHTLNEMETDQQRELELRKKNNPEEARKLVETVLDKIEKGLLESSCSLEDVKLLVLFQSYRARPGYLTEKQAYTTKAPRNIRRSREQMITNTLGTRYF